jgi:DedD protein
MDPALKQRLIGAAVLVALAVIFLPMLLGGPSPSSQRGSDVPLSIPAAPDRPLTTREIPLGLPPAPEPSASAPVDPDRVVTVDADIAPRIDALDAADRPADSIASDPPAAMPPQAANPSTPPATAVTTASTPAPPPAAAEPVAGAAGGSRFVVNLGSYTNRDNAEALRARLQKAGVTVYAESISVDGKPATRLRAGPYANRGEAEAARQRVQRSEGGLPASVLTLDAGETPREPAKPAVAAGFAVQVGALKSEQEAQALRERLRVAGFAAYIERAATDAGVLWRVRAGPELKRERAEALRDEIRRKLSLDGLVVGHP